MNTTTGTATARVDVACDPQTAFTVFTADIGAWWRRGTSYWNDPARAVTLRFEPFVGGRFIEVYDADSGEGFTIGEVRVWEPGARLVFGWRNQGWRPDQHTEVSVRFEKIDTGTRITIEHSGWEQFDAEGTRPGQGYGHGWGELLGFFSDRIAAA